MTTETGFPRSPKLMKGALVVYASHSADRENTKVIPFQYNPDQVSRTLAKRTPSGGSSGGAKEDVLRVEGPPVESITLSIVLDATDQLGVSATGTTTHMHGLYPVLATLELLLYPSSEQVQQGEEQIKAGAVQIDSGRLPLTLLVWGKSRVVPVLLTSFSVTEQAFDPSLNPIRVKVDLGLRVLTNQELQPDTQGYKAFSSYHKEKERLASLHTIPGATSKEYRSLLPAGKPKKKGG